MTDLSDAHALAVERSCAVTAVALSGQRREGVRLVTGEHRQFSLNAGLDYVLVPYPSLAPDWTRRTLTGGVALQCAPSKERLAHFRLNELTARELRALTLVEAGVALGWVAVNWPGLVVEAQRLLPDLEALPDDMAADAMLERAISLTRNGQPVGDVPAVVGRLPLAYTVPQ
ncbi:MorD protein, partial [Mycolicibacterium pulveris]